MVIVKIVQVIAKNISFVLYVLCIVLISLHLKDAADTVFLVFGASFT